MVLMLLVASFVVRRFVAPKPRDVFRRSTRARRTSAPVLSTARLDALRLGCGELREHRRDGAGSRGGAVADGGRSGTGPDGHGAERGVLRDGGCREELFFCSF